METLSVVLVDLAGVSGGGWRGAGFVNRLIADEGLALTLLELAAEDASPNAMANSGNACE